ncbi:MAG: Holliday junction branch migration protein RuvA [Planctomycetota bacterium]
MLTRLTGTLESVDDALTFTVAGFAIRAEAPRYLLDRLAESDLIGTVMTVHTRADLESHNQGTSFTPRLIAFMTAEERRFFEIFTSVKGLGAKRALRALTEEPGYVAAAVVSKDARALQRLPEIGKRLAETVIAELSGKVDGFAAVIDANGTAPATGRGVGVAIEPSRFAPAAEEAVAALLALGETRHEAERKIGAAVDQAGGDADTQTLIDAVFGRN